MRKRGLIAGGVAAALTTAAVATAAVFTASGITPTTAHGFTAAKTSVESRSCTGADNKQFTITRGRYTGSVNFDNPAAELDGPLTIDARTTYSTTDGYGIVEGSFRVKDADTRLSGKITGTLKGTQFVGYLGASARGAHATVVGNISATFDPATGFTAGEVGSGSSTAVLAVLAGPVCKGSKSEHKSEHSGSGSTQKPKTIRVEGTVASLGANNASVTVTAKGPVTATCYTDSTTAALLNGLAPQAKVEITCASATPNVATSWMLKTLKKK